MPRDYDQLPRRPTSPSSAPASPDCPRPGSWRGHEVASTRGRPRGRSFEHGHRAWAAARSPSTPASSSTTNSNYPNLTALFDHWASRRRRARCPSRLSLDDGRFEYAGAASACSAQPGNLRRRASGACCARSLRFYREAPGARRRGRRRDLHAWASTSTASGYSDAFIDGPPAADGRGDLVDARRSMRDYPATASSASSSTTACCAHRSAALAHGDGRQPRLRRSG